MAVENGVDNREEDPPRRYAKDDWYAEADDLARQIEQDMGGDTTIVTVEPEFNKNGIAAPAYCDQMDRYLTDVVQRFEAVDGVQTIVAFGNWDRERWTCFSDAVAASSLLGTQLLRSEFRNPASVHESAEDTQQGLQALLESFPGPQHPDETFVYDWGVSTWGGSPDAGPERVENEAIQAQEIRELRENRSELRQELNLAGFVFRNLNHTDRDWGYHGDAECCWGFAGEDMEPTLEGYEELRTWAIQEQAHTAQAQAHTADEVASRLIDRALLWTLAVFGGLAVLAIARQVDRATR